jgi:hypothetical protein
LQERRREKRFLSFDFDDEEPVLEKKLHTKALEQELFPTVVSE